MCVETSGKEGKEGKNAIRDKQMIGGKKKEWKMCEMEANKM